MSPIVYSPYTLGDSFFKINKKIILIGIVTSFSTLSFGGFYDRLLLGDYILGDCNWEVNITYRDTI